MDVRLRCGLPCLWIETQMHFFSDSALLMVQYVVAMLSYHLRSKADNEMQNRHLPWLRQTYLFIWINDAIIQGQMLITLRSDPSRWVNWCIHLYLLFFSSKRLSCRQNLWGFAVLIMQTDFDEYVLPWCCVMEETVCVYEVFPFSEDYLSICQRAEERRGEETKGCFSFRDKTLCRWNWHQKVQAWLHSNKCSMCMPLITDVKALISQNTTAC